MKSPPLRVQSATSSCVRLLLACLFSRAARDEKPRVPVYYSAMSSEPSASPALHPTEHLDWPARRPLVRRYGLALAVVVAAFGLRYAIFGTHDHRFPFIFFVPAAMIAAWYGGMAPGLMATAAGLLL